MSSYEEHREFGDRQSAQNQDQVDDRLSETVFDVVVVGSGAAALSAATTAARDGASVVVLEAASGIGGTTAKSSGGFWIPRNRVMRERGFDDDRDGCLAHMARLSYPQHYDRGAERHGLEQAAWDLIVNYYDNAVGAIEDLESTGDLDYMIMESFRGDNRGLPPWYATEEDGVTYGRLLAPTPTDASPAQQSDHLAVFTSRDGDASASNKSAAAMRSQGATQGDGTDLVRQLLHAAKRYGATVVVEHRVLDLVTDDGAVVGVVAESPGGTVTVEARQGVVFGTGGMEHDEELRARFLRGPIVGTCGVSTNRGDFIRMAERIGADFANTREAWWAELPLESCLKSFEQGDLISQIYGDASILVNAEGHRVVNEKLMYNERGKVHFVQDESGGYPNYLLFMVFDDAVVQDTTPWPSRWPVPYPDAIGPDVLTGATLAELGQAIADRLTRLSEFTGGFSLKSGFAAQLARTVHRFNGFALAGRDDDFGRGETITDTYFTPDTRKEPMPNPTMYPFSETGPYYAVILGASCLGTKGGPRINTKSQVVRPDGTPIPGLYGAGNCIASPAGAAYWGGGSTLGPALTHGYLAGKHVTMERVRQPAAR